MTDTTLHTCQANNCDNTFTLHPQGQSKRFCSERCRRRSMTAKNEFTCSRVACGKTYLSFATQSNFCSKSCAAIEHNTGRIKREYENCLKCDKPLRGTNGKKFCSRNCRFQYHQQVTLQDWINGKVSLMHQDGGLPKLARKYLIDRSESKCRCGWGEANPVLGYAILTINHIDGNSRNNYISNLEVLCYNCHTLTPTFGYLNLGQGRGALKKKLENLSVLA